MSGILMTSNVIVVSACLLGTNCKYTGENNYWEKAVHLLSHHRLLPLCPEQLGGLTTPRDPAEIREGDGSLVLERKAQVLTKEGKDVTEAFIKGAEESLKLAKAFGADMALFKARSPSCGCGRIYDGSFKSSTQPGDGVTTSLFKKNGIKVFTEESFPFSVDG